MEIKNIKKNLLRMVWQYSQHLRSNRKSLVASHTKTQEIKTPNDQEPTQGENSSHQ